MLPSPAAPAAAALGAEVVDLDRWRHHFEGRDAEELAGLERSYSVSGRAVLSHSTASAPIRLTRRGIAVMVALSVGAALATVFLAWLCVPPAARTPSGSPQHSAPTTVTVKSGDSLWSIAADVAPTRDPRAEIDQLRTLNHLTTESLTPGQRLRTR
jgi:nucleoid-associated protein YgaU